MEKKLDLDSLQHIVRAANLDGWLWYDFKGLNPFPAQFLDLGHSILTRRWFLYIPAVGRPVLLHQHIEATSWLSILPDERVERKAYASHGQLDSVLRDTLKGAGKIAMEYSPLGELPMVSYVDAGTLERVRACGVEVVSSADLLQHLLAWTPEDLRAHETAVKGLVAAKDQGFDLIRQRLKAGKPVGELEVQKLVCDAMHAAGLVYDYPPIVGFGSHAGQGHYSPDLNSNRILQTGDCVLIDLWAGLPDRPMADITWVGFAGNPPPEYLKAWEVVRDARDLALRLLTSGSVKYGWEVDRAAKDLMIARGYGDSFRARLGHSLGRNMPHGQSVNLDDWETHDTRLLLPGLGLTVEPGIAGETFGVRSEVNVYLTPGGAVVTTPVQSEPYWLE